MTDPSTSSALAATRDGGRAACPAGRPTPGLRSHGRAAPALPNPRTWSMHLAQAALELVAGRRTSAQLAGWATGAALADFTSSAPAGLGAGRLRSVRAMAVGPAHVEAVVLVDCGQRTRAMAIRLVGVNMPLRPHGRHQPGPRWLATSLRVL